MIREDTDILAIWLKQYLFSMILTIVLLVIVASINSYHRLLIGQNVSRRVTMVILTMKGFAESQVWSCRGQIYIYILGVEALQTAKQYHILCQQS